MKSASAPHLTPTTSSTIGALRRAQAEEIAQLKKQLRLQAKKAEETQWQLQAQAQLQAEGVQARGKADTQNAAERAARAQPVRQAPTDSVTSKGLCAKHCRVRFTSHYSLLTTCY